MNARFVPLGAAIAMLATAPAIADRGLGPLVQVSDESPFGPLEECGNFPGEFFGVGVNFVDSEVEPWVEVNPIDPDNIVAFWQQDRWSNGGARSNVAGVSLDGGATFETVVVPILSDCTGGEFERATDPWLSFSPNGVLHQISLVFNQDPPEPDPLALGGRNGIAVSRSSDGGLNWTDPILIIDDTDPLLFNDKETLTADPTDSDFVYAVWDRLESLTEVDFRGPGLFARSTDGGVSWEEAREVFDPGSTTRSSGLRWWFCRTAPFSTSSTRSSTSGRTAPPIRSPSASPSLGPTTRAKPGRRPSEVLGWQRSCLRASSRPM